MSADDRWHGGDGNWYPYPVPSGFWRGKDGRWRPPVRRVGPWARWILPVIAAVVLAAVAAGIWTYEREVHRSFAGMVATAQSFPFPPGYTVEEVTIQGDGCAHSFDPGCTVPLALVAAHPPPGRSAACADVATSVARWPGGHSFADARYGGVCGSEGIVNGYPVSVTIQLNTLVITVGPPT